MKTFIFSIIIAAGITSTLSCKKTNSPTGEPHDPSPVADTVHLQTATDAISRYAQWLVSSITNTSHESSDSISFLVSTSFSRAFLINGDDLIGVLNPADTPMVNAWPFKRARAYLGMHSDHSMHLYLTPVMDNGNDTILVDSLGNQFVYDLILPCPNTCDNTGSSPLDRAFTDSCLAGSSH